MQIKVLGVCGSPIKGGNTEVFLVEALKAAAELPDVETELIPLAGKDIKDCVHCNWCLVKQSEGKYCNIKDDMGELFPKVLEADVLLLASPVYLGRLSGYAANFIDRMRVLAHGNYYKRRLNNKVGGALSTVWFRHTGQETTLLTIIQAFMMLYMVPANPGMAGALGAGGVTSHHGEGGFDPKDKHEILKDEFGLKAARTLGRRAVALAKALKVGAAELEAVPILED